MIISSQKRCTVFRMFLIIGHCLIILSTFIFFTSGTILFSFSLFGKIIGCAMLANAGFNIFILFKYPQYEDAQRNDAQSEIRDYLSANPAFAKTVVKAGTEFVLSNPDIVKKSAESWATLPQQEPRV